MVRVSHVIEVIREARVPAGADRCGRSCRNPAVPPTGSSFADRTDVLSGDGVGQRRTQHGQWGGKRSEVDQEIIECVPDRLLAWKHIAERLDGKPAPGLRVVRCSASSWTVDGDATIVRLRSLQTPANACARARS